MATATQQSRPSLALASDLARALHLAPNFQPDVDLLVAEGMIAFGVKGAGKSNLVALTVEQLGRFFLPQLILDTEREQHSLVNLLPHGVIATANRCPSGYDILNKGLQVIVDLRSWETDEAAALAVCQLIHELFTVSSAQSYQDRVPCVIHLDEASYWLPQEAVTYLSKDTRQAMADAFHKLASRGRKQGLTPFLYTHNISEVTKSAIRQSGVKVLMRQTLDIDLDRCCQYIRGATARTRKAVQAFPTGKAVVILPDGGQQTVQFDVRASEHVSHTPRTQAAIAKFAGLHIDVAELDMRDMTPDEPGQGQRLASKAKHAPTIRERVFSLLEKDDTLTPKLLAAIIGCPPNTAQVCRREYLTRQPRVYKQEQRIRALLAENSSYSTSQLARRANCSHADVKRWLGRIQASGSASPISAACQK